MATSVANQTSYLKRLAATGTAGQKAWANSQLKNVAASAATPTSSAPTYTAPKTTNTTVTASSPSSSSGNTVKATTSSTPSTTSYSNMNASQLANQNAYLNSLISSGGGNAVWAANEQAKVKEAATQLAGQQAVMSGGTMTTGQGGYYTNYVAPVVDSNYIDAILNNTVPQYTTDVRSGNYVAGTPVTVNTNPANPIGVATTTTPTATTQVATTPTPTVTTPTVTETPAATTAQLESDLFALQERQRIQALEAAKKSGLDALALERGKIDPMYNNLVAQTAGQAARSGLSFAEFMAARGLTNSGSALQGQINLMGEQNRAVSDINLQRANAFADIASRETAVQNAYDTGVVDATIQKSIDQTNALIAAQKSATEFAQKLQLMGMEQQNAIDLANLKAANDLKEVMANINAKYASAGSGNGNTTPNPIKPSTSYTPGNGASNRPGNTYTQMDVNNAIFPNRSPEGMRAAAQNLIKLGVPEQLIANALRQAGVPI